MSWLLDPYYRALLMQAFGTTLLISVAVIAASNLLALPLAIHMQRPGRWTGRAIRAYSFLARAVPVLAVLFALYYGLPRFGIYLEPVPSAIIGLTLASTAYNFEFMRSGFAAVPPGQHEAGEALGLRPWLVQRKIVLPQAFAAAAPALFSNAVQIVKGSSLASLVSVTELTGASTTIIAETYRAIEVLTFVGVLYGLLAVVIIVAQAVYESQQRWQRR